MLAQAAKKYQSLLRVQNLCVDLLVSKQKTKTLVHDIQFELFSGQTLALVGASGSGKTLTALAILSLLDVQRFRVTGQVYLGNTDVLSMAQQQNRFDFRGREIGMIFQDPTLALNPLMRVGMQITEVCQRHNRVKRKVAKLQALKLLTQVGWEHPESVYRAYAHELSGGMCQRIMIAMALAGKPQILIADEATSSLDVVAEQQLCKLLKNIQRDYSMAILFITHDLSLLPSMADSVAFLNQGQIVEHVAIKDLENSIQHAYAQTLYQCHEIVKDV